MGYFYVNHFLILYSIFAYFTYMQIFFKSFRQMSHISEVFRNVYNYVYETKQVFCDTCVFCAFIWNLLGGLGCFFSNSRCNFMQISCHPLGFRLFACRETGCTSKHHQFFFCILKDYLNAFSQDLINGTRRVQTGLGILV